MPNCEVKSGGFSASGDVVVFGGADFGGSSGANFGGSGANFSADLNKLAHAAYVTASPSSTQETVSGLVYVWHCSSLRTVKPSQAASASHRARQPVPPVPSPVSCLTDHPFHNCARSGGQRRRV